jgi:hypothetical protein
MLRSAVQSTNDFQTAKEGGEASEPTQRVFHATRTARNWR